MGDVVVTQTGRSRDCPPFDQIIRAGFQQMRASDRKRRFTCYRCLKLRQRRPPVSIGIALANGRRVLFCCERARSISSLNRKLASSVTSDSVVTKSSAPFMAPFGIETGAPSNLFSGITSCGGRMSPVLRSVLPRNVMPKRSIMYGKVESAGTRPPRSVLNFQARR